jgi:RNA polymerase sigma-70 factor (ECF subfamily)
MARNGDPAALRTLYETHVDSIYRLAYRMGGDATQAEDWTQEIFVRAFQRLEGFREEASFRTWLGAVAMSVILNGLRRVKRDRSLLQSDQESDSRGIEQKETVTPDVILRRHLFRAIDDLPEILRSAFILHEVEGYPVNEIGEMLGAPSGTIKARLFRAREKLRESLHDRGRQSAATAGPRTSVKGNGEDS